MRILSLVTLLAAFASDACYSPSVADCQFKCTNDTACPSEQTCSNGICRDPGATQQCPGETFDSGVADSPTPDASKLSCPTVPNPSCTLFSSLALPCFAICSDVETWSNAESACSADGAKWALANLDGDARLNAANSPAQPTWTGLLHPSGSGSDGADWTWLVGNGVVTTTASQWIGGAEGTLHGGTNITDCGAYEGVKYYADPCTNTHPYACAAARSS